ncbi:hypothetical protein [Shinella zoogloeoides]|uniref:Uncharacterized protein n=1 Tax=Shinella zoogloeoides TaxID=352475 RepID=A0A6N8TAN8_SHIZO|nr:hypothetical protein [Shinella zoogloeoides]MXN99660.1 hypothetical protein [Shinella zoogloeoides]UEX80840.1 hypothetical protein K8M09_14725 [Shinella zoogloeoides]
MQNILKFTRRETLIGGDHENKDADTVLRSMAVVTQQLERMLDVLRENARQESRIAQTELSQAPGK